MSARERNGVQKRVVENWLTNANELAYTIPFAQLLLAQGHKVLHISPQGSMEQGKDIISIDPDGVVCCYQLKAGNISLAEWRNIKGEVYEVVELKPPHPSLPNFDKWRGFLVTNGDLSDPTRRAIDDRNKQLKQKGEIELEVIVRGQLLDDFNKFYGQYLPDGIADFSRFLTLYQSPGAEPLGKPEFTSFLESLTAPLLTNSKPGKNKARQLLNGMTVVTSYILGGKIHAENSMAVVDGWLLLLAEILRVVEVINLEDKYYRNCVDLVLEAIDRHLCLFVDEVISSDSLIIEEPNSYLESVTYHPRVTKIGGYLTAHQLFRRIRGLEAYKPEEISEFLNEHAKEFRTEGEYAFAYLVNISLYRQSQGSVDRDDLLVSMLTTCVQSARGKSGLPDPYHELEDIVRKGLNINDAEFGESFTGRSYVLDSLMHLAARYGIRDTLSDLWKPISHINLHEFIPDQPSDLLRWHNEKGRLDTKFPNQTQSWSALVAESQKDSSSKLPKGLLQYPEITGLALCAMPHRQNRETIMFLAQQVDKTLS